MRAIRSEGIPLIVSPNLWITDETKDKYPYQEIEAQLISADRIICNSNLECETLSEVFNINRSKFSTVYNGINESFLEFVDPVIFRVKYNINEKYVLNVANIEKRKNQLKFLEALKNFPHLKLVVIGHVRDPEYLQKCQEFGGEQFCYLGSLEHDSIELKSAYSGCEFFALPSLLETPGLAALEAAGAGAKVLITSEGSTKEYFKNFATYIDPNDQESISTGISSVLLAPKNNNLRNHIADRFTWKEVIKDLVKIYQNHRVTNNSQIKLNNFYLEENLIDEWFAWSKLESSINSEEGKLVFEWRSPDHREVDLYLNGNLYNSGVLLGANWSPYMIDMLGSKPFLELKVKGIKENINSERILGVAIKNIDLLKNYENLSSTEIKTWLLSKGLFFESQNIKSDGFYLPEKENDEWFAWSKLESSINSEEGKLVFEWRSPDHREVDLYLNGNLYNSGVLLGANWSPYMIDMLGSKPFLELKVKGIKENINSERILGVAIKNIDLLKNYENLSSTEIKTWLLSKGLFFESQNIKSDGFYLQEKENDEWFIWGKFNSSLELNQGDLTFEWRSVVDSSVDIYLNGHKLVSSFKLGQEWEVFSMNISSENTKNIIEFKITREVEFVSVDPRELGIAIKNIKLLEG
jgi:hypothetical protein